MKVVPRAEFAKFIRLHPELEGKPVESTTLAAMQYVNDQNQVQAQAIYYRGLAPVYNIRSTNP